MGFLRRAVPALLLLFAATSARAEERIQRFISDVQIQKDSSLDVTETIDVRAEHNRINRGIYRDFPTRYRGRNGSQVRVGFTFRGATMDGMPVHAWTETIPNGVRVLTGTDELIPIGDHRYVIRYSTTRQVGRFKDYDELYWNATGNRLGFPHRRRRSANPLAGEPFASASARCTQGHRARRPRTRRSSRKSRATYSSARSRRSDRERD